MPIHDLNDRPQRQRQHPVLLILYQAHIDTDKFLAVGDAAPGDGGELGDCGGAKVGEETGAAEDAGGRDAVLGGAEAGVELRPGFEDESGDVGLGEEDGEEEA